MFFKFEPFQGPASYTWKDPDTGTLFSESKKDTLMTRITLYREQNNLEPIEHLSFVLENYWCSLPENAGKCVPATVERGILGYFKGGVALVKNLWYGNFAPQMVADKRSSQCSECPHNTFPDKQGFIAWSDRIAEASVGNRKSKHHDKLGNCGVCSCPLRAKVFFTGKVDIEPAWEEPMKSVDCWQLKLRKNG